MFKIGCHLSISNGFLAAAKQITAMGGNAFQYFSRNPQGGRAKAFDEKDYLAFLDYNQDKNITLLCHAPYTLNPCSITPQTREFARMVFKQDIAILDKFPRPLYNFHPGSHTGQGVEVGIQQIVEILNEIITPEQKTIVLLETMSGKGSEVGRTFEELQEIISHVNYQEKIGVCLDTCHVYSAGYDIVNDLDGVLHHFDEVIGLNKLYAIHLNDSKMLFGSNKDRHEKIGEGSLGLDAIRRIVTHPSLTNLPFFLETPNEIEGYSAEIALLKDIVKNN